MFSCIESSSQKEKFTEQTGTVDELNLRKMDRCNKVYIKNDPTKVLKMGLYSFPEGRGFTDGHVTKPRITTHTLGYLA